MRGTRSLASSLRLLRQCLLLGFLLTPVMAVGQSFEEMQRLAEQGYADAQYNLGVMYNVGRGVPEDDVEAVKWYRISARAGHPGSQNALGAMYEHGETVNVDMAKAYFWYTLAAGSGNAEASHNRSRLKAELDTDELRHIGDALEHWHQQRH